MRERVAAEWKREQEVRAKDRYLAELRRKYDIVADAEVTALIALPAGRQEGEP
jgi:predicted Zn-dependent protease